MVGFLSITRPVISHISITMISMTLIFDLHEECTLLDLPDIIEYHCENCTLLKLYLVYKSEVQAMPLQLHHNATLLIQTRPNYSQQTLTNSNSLTTVNEVKVLGLYGKPKVEPGQNFRHVEVFAARRSTFVAQPIPSCGVCLSVCPLVRLLRLRIIPK